MYSWIYFIFQIYSPVSFEVLSIYFNKTFERIFGLNLYVMYLYLYKPLNFLRLYTLLNFHFSILLLGLITGIKDNCVLGKISEHKIQNKGKCFYLLFTARTVNFMIRLNIASVLCSGEWSYTLHICTSRDLDH